MSDKQPPHLHESIRDRERLQEIVDLGMASKHQHPALEELLDTARHTLQLPIGLVSIVLDGAQFFAVQQGLSGWLEKAGGTPVEWSFCTNVVVDEKPFIVTDAQTDERVKDNPLVTQEGIRSYAGVPLKTSKGVVLGSFCVIGSEAREFKEEDVRLLRELAAKAIRAIEQSRPDA